MHLGEPDAEVGGRTMDAVQQTGAAVRTGSRSHVSKAAVAGVAMVAVVVGSIVAASVLSGVITPGGSSGRATGRRPQLRRDREGPGRDRRVGRGRRPQLRRDREGPGRDRRVGRGRRPQLRRDREGPGPDRPTLNHRAEVAVARWLAAAIHDRLDVAVWEWSGREDLNLRPSRPERCALQAAPRPDRGCSFDRACG